MQPLERNLVFVVEFGPEVARLRIRGSGPAVEPARRRKWPGSRMRTARLAGWGTNANPDYARARIDIDALLEPPAGCQDYRAINLAAAAPAGTVPVIACESSAEVR